MAEGRRPHEKCGALGLGLDRRGRGWGTCLECDEGLEREGAELEQE